MTQKIFQKTFLVLIIISQSTILSQQNIIKNDSYFYPTISETWKFKSIITLSFSQLPEDIIEEVNSLIYSPLINYDASLEIPYNFNLHGSLTSNIVTNHFLLGTNWRYNFNNFAISVGYDIAFWFGILEDFDFASRNVGWLHYPNLTIGYAFDKFTVSAKTEIVLNTFYTQFVDNIEVTTEKNTVSGYCFALYVEQPLWKNNIMSLGIKANFSRFYYPVWMAYSNSYNFRFIPEIQIGLVL